MPHLKIFKRTWKRSEDEFVISSIAQALLRTILYVCPLVLSKIRVVVAGALLLSNYQLQNVISSAFKVSSLMLTSSYLQGILITAVTLCILHIILFIVIAAVSGQGGVMEVQKRKPIGTLIFVHFILMILELIFYCLSIWQVVVLYKDSNNVRILIYLSYKQLRMDLIALFHAILG